MKKIVNQSTWHRNESFDFFKDFMNPYISVTCHVDCRKAKTSAHEQGCSFFLYYLHAILKAVNGIPELHYRIDTDGNIVEYDSIGVLSPMKIAGRTGFVTMHFPYHKSRTEFCNHAVEIMKQMSRSSVFGAESACKEYDVVLVSAVLDLPFTSMSCTQRHKNGNDYPLINVGMMDADYRMPIALSVHHGFVDGEHIAEFYKIVQIALDE